MGKKEKEIIISMINTLECTKCGRTSLPFPDGELGWYKCPSIGCRNNEFKVHIIGMNYTFAIGGMKRTYCLECMNEYDGNELVCTKCGTKR